MKPSHFVSAACKGERCRCNAEATHKVAEEVPHDEPVRVDKVGADIYISHVRMGMSAYVCCAHFKEIFAVTICPSPLPPEPEEKCDELHVRLERGVKAMRDGLAKLRRDRNCVNYF